LTVAKSDGAQVLQVVVGLFFGLWVVLVAVASSAGEVVRTLEHLQGYLRDVVTGDVQLIADRQRGVDDVLPPERPSCLVTTPRPWINEQYCLR
jgi:hypothetical protein